METATVFVKTTYVSDGAFIRKPNISSYSTEIAAREFLKTCLLWGIGIDSCEGISEEEAKQLIEQDLVEYEPYD